MCSNTEINFKGDNPGAVRFGNFINYYQFHPVGDRIQLLPRDVWEIKDKCICLDIGCNAGELTAGVLEFLMKIFGDVKFNFLGIDIDPVLITRANECNKYNELIEYRCMNFMDEKYILHKYLSNFNIDKFSITFCFSVTMWIHLNYGDEGLERFIIEVCNLSEIVVVEPQPWKCYRAAVKRLKQSNADFPLFKQLKYRNNIEIQIENIFKKCQFVKFYESPDSNWGRKLQFYKKCL